MVPRQGGNSSIPVCRVIWPAMIQAPGKLGTPKEEPGVVATLVRLISMRPWYCRPVRYQYLTMIMILPNIGPMLWILTVRVMPRMCVAPHCQIPAHCMIERLVYMLLSWTLKVQSMLMGIPRSGEKSQRGSPQGHGTFGPAAPAPDGVQLSLSQWGRWGIPSTMFKLFLVGEMLKP